MTDEQKEKIEKFSDLMLLCELAMAFGNTPNAQIGSYGRAQIMNILEELNLEHIEDLP